MFLFPTYLELEHFANFQLLIISSESAAELYGMILLMMFSSLLSSQRR